MMNRKVIIVTNQISPDAPRPTTMVNRTVFVDPGFGSDTTGRVQDSSRPFRTISAAIAAINVAAPNRTATTIWLVRLSPGIYAEDIAVSPWIDVEGSGSSTLLRGTAHVSGNSTFSSFRIDGTNLPVLRVDFPSTVREQEFRARDLSIAFSGSSTASDRSAVVLSENGLNNVTSMSDTRIALDFDAITGGSNTAISQEGSMLSFFKDVDVSLISNPSSAVTVFGGGGILRISGGTFAVTLGPTAPTQDVVFFDAGSGELEMRGTVATILEAIVENATSKRVPVRKSKGRLNFIRSAPAAPKAEGPSVTYVLASTANCFVENSSLDFFTVPPLQRTLVNATTPGAEVFLLNVATRETFVPAVRGFTGGVRYFALSAEGNMTSNGGLYTNIKTISSNIPNEAYFPQDNDQTINVADIPLKISLEDPALVSEEVVYKGKVLTINNIATEDVTVEGKIHSGSPMLIAPGNSAVFQNDGTEWFVLSR